MYRVERGLPVRAGHECVLESSSRSSSFRGSCGRIIELPSAFTRVSIIAGGHLLVPIIAHATAVFASAWRASMQGVLLIAMFGMLPATGLVQTADDREAVLKTVQMFFDTMTARDVDGARRILMPEGRFHAMDLRKPSEPSSFTNEEYLGRLPKSTRQNRERMWNPEVRVHGSIATVWTPYDFWTDGKFSHCGVDAFDLIRTAEGWKISGGTFTIEAKCEPSPLGPLKQ